MPHYQAGDEPVPGYRILNEIGSGGFGVVYRVRGPGGTELALKVIGLDRREGIKEFRSLQIAKDLKFPHLSPIFACWLKTASGEILSDDEIDSLARRLGDTKPEDLKKTLPAGVPAPVGAELVIAMGLGEKNLLARMEEAGGGGIPIDELLDYMDGAAKAIDYLNLTAGVRHCDIKPQNLLIVGGDVQLCDYGLARRADDLRTTKAHFSLAYAAPECLANHGPGPATDQYSLAVSYCELRTGSLPLADQNSVVAVTQAHLQGKLDLSKLPEPEQRVIRRATSVDPAKRFANCRSMVRALHEAVGSSQYAATPPRRRRGGLIAFVAILLLAGAGYGAWIGSGRPPLPAWLALQADEPSVVAEKGSASGAGGRKRSDPAAVERQPAGESTVKQPDESGGTGTTDEAGDVDPVGAGDNATTASSDTVEPDYRATELVDVEIWSEPETTTSDSQSETAETDTWSPDPRPPLSDVAIEEVDPAEAMSPEEAMAEMLAATLLEARAKLAVDEPAAAARALDDAASQYPGQVIGQDVAQVRKEIASELLSEGDFELAERQLTAAIDAGLVEASVWADRAYARMELSRAAVTNKQGDDARRLAQASMDDFEKAASLDSSVSYPFERRLSTDPNLALLELRAWSERFEDRNDIVAADFYRALNHFKLGRHGRAALLMRQVVDRIKDPTTPLAVRARTLAALWMSGQAESKSESAWRALQLARDACTATDFKEAAPLDALAAAHAATGSFDAAQRRAEQAIELAEGETKAEYEARLALYREGKTFRLSSEDE